MTNRFDDGVQIRNIHASSFFTQKSIASEKHVDKYFLNKTIVDKPFSVKTYVVSSGFVLLRLRKKCNGVSPTCFLVDSFVETKVLAREFSANVGLESEQLKRSILEDLKGRKQSTDCLMKRINIRFKIKF